MAKISGMGIAAAVLVAFVAAVCIRLGFWQLERLEERRAANVQLAAALAAPPLDLRDAMLDSVAAHPERYRFRRARVAGVYAPAGTFLLRGRARAGSPGVHLIAPLYLENDDRAILVDRGWLPAPDAATADPRPYRYEGAVVVEGLLRPLGNAAGDARPVTLRIAGAAVPSYQRLDSATLRGQISARLLPVYLQRAPASKGAERLPLAEPIPAVSEGPHLGYAFQWFSFAAIAVIGFAVALVRGRKRG